MAQHRLLRAQANRRQSRWLVWLLAAGLVRFAIHQPHPFVGRSVVPTTPAPAHRRARIIQDRKDLLWSHPALYVDLLAYNPPRRLQHARVLSSACAEFAFPVRWNFHPDHLRPQMRNIAKKLHRTFPISVLHLAVGRTHPTGARKCATLQRNTPGLSLSPF